MTTTHQVLYVEDNAVNVRLVEKILSFRPHVELIVAGTGELGLTLAAQKSPDLILLDWRLPVMQGAEVLQLLKSDPATADIPIVVFSGDSGRDQIDAILASGAVRFVPKPFAIDELLGVVDAFCS